MDVARLTASLVRIQSENPPGSTSDVVEFIRDLLETLGMKSRVLRHPGGHDNVVTTGPGARLLLCGHVDVVPAMAEGWVHDPYGGEIADGFVWGRGTTDMKGGCAALLTAYANLLDRGIEPKVQFAFVCDEETGGEFGIRSLIAEDALTPRDCLIAEPTPPLCPSIGQKGLYRVDLCFRGEPGHSSLFPLVGKSAVMEAVSLIEKLQKLHERSFPVSDDLLPLVANSSRALREIFGIESVADALTKIMYNPGRIEGGEKANIVAQRCRMEVDIRLPWGCSLERLREYVAFHAPNATILEMDAAEPTLTRPDARLVGVICSEVERVYRKASSPIVQWAATDAKYLRKEGFDVVEYGPGEITRLHAIDERVSVDNLEKAVDVYTGVMAAYSG
jgi:succinyl-diaminopimelate desuccinylase